MNMGAPGLDFQTWDSPTVEGHIYDGVSMFLQVCASLRYRRTVKERNSESGNDFFGARYATPWRARAHWCGLTISR